MNLSLHWKHWVSPSIGVTRSLVAPCTLGARACRICWRMLPLLAEDILAWPSPPALALPYSVCYSPTNMNILCYSFTFSRHFYLHLRSDFVPDHKTRRNWGKLWSCSLSLSLSFCHNFLSQLNEGTVGETTSILLIISLITLVFYGITTNFMLRRTGALIGISLYILFIIFVVSSEFELTHAFGTEHSLDRGHYNDMYLELEKKK